jgi:hypothetical protein
MARCQRSGGEEQLRGPARAGIITTREARLTSTVVAWIRWAMNRSLAVPTVAMRNEQRSRSIRDEYRACLEVAALDLGAIRSSRFHASRIAQVPGSDAPRWLQANAAVCELRLRRDGVLSGA